MGIALIDYANYPFLRGVAMDLRAHGEAIDYAYSASFQSPNQHSAATVAPVDGIVALALDQPFEKASLIKRRRQEIDWARRCVAWLDQARPTMVLAANCPLEVLDRLHRWCRHRGTAFIPWVQDVHGLAITRILGRKLPGLGHLVGWWYERMEHRLLRQADHVILISPDHRDLARRAGQTDERASVLENWATLADHPLRPKDNPWSRRHGLDRTDNVIYAGTLGMKHDPGLLLALARELAHSRPSARVVVISEGVGARWLAERVAAEPCTALVLLPFQPFEDLPDAMAAADILTSILEADASLYSVPSKTLTYLCAGRAQVAALPAGNLAARNLTRIGAGEVVVPINATSYCQAVIKLLDAPDRRTAMGRAARAYAEVTFAPARIRADLLAIIDKVRPSAEGGGRRAAVAVALNHSTS